MSDNVSAAKVPKPWAVQRCRYEAGKSDGGFPRALALGCGTDRRTVANRSNQGYAGPMAKTIAQRELRNDNAKVIEAVTAGETFIVTRNGEPVAELRPITARRRTFVSRAEIDEMAGAGVRIDHRRFREDLDAALDQRVDR